jgi:malate dehydrogenase
VREWVLGSNGRWVSMGLPSDGDYGVPEDVMFGVPVICEGGAYHRVKGLPVDEFSRTRIDHTLKELLEEQEAVASLLV